MSSKIQWPSQILKLSNLEIFTNIDTKDQIFSQNWQKKLFESRLGRDGG